MTSWSFSKHSFSNGHNSLMKFTETLYLQGEGANEETIAHNNKGWTAVMLPVVCHDSQPGDRPSLGNFFRQKMMKNKSRLSAGVRRGFFQSSLVNHDPRPL
jgi:hypothetical protein